jgi:hypothetical protein
MLTERTERCAVARGEPDGGHAAQHLSNIKMASRRLCPPYGSQRHVARMSAATCGIGRRGRPRISRPPALFERRQPLIRATKLRDLALAGAATPSSL